MKIHLFFILCVVKTSFSRSSRKNDAKLEGNVMIERILNADRFDELADKIVNKALEKLKHETSKLSDSIKTNTPAEPISAQSALRQSKKAHKSKVSKIDINAVLQKKVIPFNELTFRYDHFTKNPDTANKKIHSKTNNKKKRQKTNEKENKEKPQLGSNEQSDKDSKSQENSDSKKNKQTDLSSENMTFNTKLQNESAEMRFGNEKLIIWGNDDKKSDETVDVDKSIEDKPMRQKKGKQTKDIHVRAHSIEQEPGSNEENDNQQKDDENQKDEAQITGYSKQAENQSTSIKLTYNTEVETTSIKVETVPAHSDKEKDENEILLRASDKELMENEAEETKAKELLDQSDMKSDDETEFLTITEAPPKKQKRIVRKEGDKLFAFEESPDYAEYHEKIAEIRKSLINHRKR